MSVATEAQLRYPRRERGKQCGADQSADQHAAEQDARRARQARRVTPGRRRSDLSHAAGVHAELRDVARQLDDGHVSAVQPEAGGTEQQCQRFDAQNADGDADEGRAADQRRGAQDLAVRRSRTRLQRGAHRLQTSCSPCATSCSPCATSNN